MWTCLYRLSEHGVKILRSWENVEVAPVRLPWRWKIGALILFAALLLLKSINVVSVPQFWAEDGNVFFLQARALGAAALFTPYAGYFHFGTRLLAWVASFFDGEYAPLIYFWLAFCVQWIVMFCVFDSALFHTFHLKLMAGLALVLIPLGSEVFFRVVNIHWHLAVLIPLLAINFPCEDYSGRWVGKIVAIIILGLTDPYIVVFAPLFFVRAVVLWRRHPERWFAFAALLCAIVQTTSILLSSAMSAGGQSSLAGIELFRAYLGCVTRYVVGFWHYPWKWYVMSEQISGCHVVIGVLSGAVLTGGVFFCAIRSWRLTWKHSAVCGLVVFLSLLAGIARGPVTYGADRYYYLPYVFTAFALMGLAFPARRKVAVSGRPLFASVVIPRVLLGIYFVLAASIYVLPRVDDLHWREEYRKAVVNPQHIIPIHPTDNLAWGIRLPPS